METEELFNLWLDAEHLRSRLSSLDQSVLNLLVLGFEPHEIAEHLDVALAEANAAVARVHRTAKQLYDAGAA